MKKLLLISLTMLVIVACGDKSTAVNKREVKEEDKLESAILTAQNSQEIEIEIFLDFKFGMTEKEVNDHIKELFKAKKIYINSDDRYQYDINDQSGFVNHITFVPHYYEGKLYEMVFPITSAIANTGNEHVFAALAFIKSEKAKEFNNFSTKDIMGADVYTHIKNNLIISFSNASTPIMKYSNAPVAKIVADLEEKERQVKSQKTSSDF